MCDPVSIGMTMMVAGTGMNMMQQYGQGKYEEQLARNNAIIQERMANDALKRGEDEERKHREQVAQFASAQKAKMGASGVIISDGSALRTLEDTAYMGELDALTIRNNAEREAYGYRVNAQNFRDDARMTRRSRNWEMADTILTGGTKVAGNWSKL